MNQRSGAPPERLLERTRGVPRCALFAALLACTPWSGEARRWAPQQPAMDAEIAAQAQPLWTADGGYDIRALWQRVRAARVVGLGSASREAGDLLALTALVVEQAAAEPKPLVIALDQPFDAGLALDAWLRGSWYPPDPNLHARDLETGLEHRVVLRRLRERNASAHEEHHTRVVGLGPCVKPTCWGWLVAYFDAVDPDFAGEVRRLARAIAASTDSDEAILMLRDVSRRLLARRDDCVALRGQEAHEEALQLVRAIGRGLDPDIAPERAMAETVAWAALRSPDARIFVLGRNTRIDRRTTEDATSLGHRLAQRFEAAYVAVHMTFDRGLTRRPTRWRGSVRGYTGWAPAGTMEATLRGREVAYILDVAAAAARDGPLAAYLRGERWGRAYPDVWKVRLDDRPAAWAPATPAQAFDVLVYVPTTYILK